MKTVIYSTHEDFVRKFNLCAEFNLSWPYNSEEIDSGYLFLSQKEYDTWPGSFLKDTVFNTLPIIEIFDLTNPEVVKQKLKDIQQLKQRQNLEIIKNNPRLAKIMDLI